MTEADLEFGAIPDFDDVTIGQGGYPEEKDPTADAQPAFTPPPPAVPASDRPTPVGVTAVSDLEALRAETRRALDLDDVDLPVPTRPGWVARYRRLLDPLEMQPWRREAYNPTILEGVDQAMLACRGLAELNTGLLIGDRLVRDEDGAPVTFRTPSFMASLHAKTPAQAVSAWYALAASAETSWNVMLGESGFDSIILPLSRQVATVPAQSPAEPPNPS